MPGVHRRVAWPTATRPRRGRSATTSATASPRARPTPRSVDAYVERVRRAHPAEPGRRRHRAGRVGAARRGVHRRRGRHRARAAALEPRAAPAPRAPTTKCSSRGHARRNMSDHDRPDALGGRARLPAAVARRPRSRARRRQHRRRRRTARCTTTTPRAAAVVIRSLRRRRARPVLPEAPRSDSRRDEGASPSCGIAAFAGVAAFGLTQRARARASPARRSPGTRPTRPTRQSLDGCRGGRRGQPRRLRRAHRLRARCCSATDLAAALREFDAASRIDPTQPEPLDLHRLDQRARRAAS